MVSRCVLSSSSCPVASDCGIPFWREKTLFDRDPSAMTASSGGNMEWRREPAKTQCGSEGLRAVALYDVQFLQQQIAGFEVDQSSMAFL